MRFQWMCVKLIETFRCETQFMQFICCGCILWQMLFYCIYIFWIFLDIVLNEWIWSFAVLQFLWFLTCNVKICWKFKDSKIQMMKIFVEQLSTSDLLKFSCLSQQMVLCACEHFDRILKTMEIIFVFFFSHFWNFESTIARKIY